MIERPEGLVALKVSFTFNYRVFRYLEIDLEHINKNARSNFVVEEVESIIKKLLKNTFLNPSGVRKYDDDFCTYFVKVGMCDESKYKVVFCICSDRPERIGVITLFRVKE